MTTTLVRRTALLWGLPVVLTLGGCATTNRNGQLSAQELHGRVLHLENLSEQRDQELAQLREELESERQARMVLEQRLGGGSTAARPGTGSLTIREVQLALKRAGFDPGTIDGKMGRRTREALRAFQQAQGLSPDGRIGPQTLVKLKAYMAAPTAGEK